MQFKEIGLKIQQAREERGLSQDQLARLIGCSQSALSNYEKGKRRLYLSQLELLSQALERPIEYFMQSRLEPENPVGDQNELQWLINEVRTMTSEERRELAVFLEYLRWRRNR
ncbi:MAG: helix-turn-helix domain-containing protein [Solirubrobacterales bacterium]